MNSMQKIAVSLLISVVLFATVAIVAYTGGFEYLEIHFYEPNKANNVYSLLSRVSANFENYYSETNEVLSEFVAQSCVKSYLKRNASEQDKHVRKSLEEYLFMRVYGLEGIRLIEKDGKRIHFSTFKNDILSESEKTVSYRNYGTENDIPYERIETTKHEPLPITVEYIMNAAVLYLDSMTNCFVFSYPLYDEYTAYRGTFVFYVNAEGFMKFLERNDVVGLNTHAVIVGEEGVSLDVPQGSKDFISKQIERCWKSNYLGVEQIAVPQETQRWYASVHEQTVTEQRADLSLYLLTFFNSQRNIYWGALRPYVYFKISAIEKALLFMTLFITTFLLIFLLLNIKQDDMTVIRSKVRHFEYVLLREYVNRRETESFEQLSQEVARRRMDVNEELKKTLGRRAVRHSAEVDELIDQCWREVAAAMGGNIVIQNIQNVSGTPIQTAGALKQNEEIVEQVQTLSDTEAELEELGEDYETVLSPIDGEENNPMAELQEFAGKDGIEELSGDEDIEELEEVEELEELEAADSEGILDMVELESVEESSAVEKARTSVEENKKLIAEREASLDNLSSADAIADFINKIAEEDAENMDDAVVEECTIEEYLAENSMLKRPAKNAEELRSKIKKSFSVHSLDFSSLDE